MACPNGTAWCPGPTGPSDRPKCSACQTQMRAARAAPPVAAPPLPPALAHVAVTATPHENLPARGSTGATMHLGVGEQVDLGNAAPPVGWTFRWSVQGDAEVTAPTPTGALLTAGATAGNVTAMLKVSAGPHHLGHTLATLSFKVIAPSGTTTRQDPNQAGLRHLNGYAGVGFKMWVNLLPNTVVFSRVQWREHTGLGLATGHFEGENGRIHAPTGQPYDANNQPTSFLSAEWRQVYGVHPAPHGVNWVGQVDTVDTGDHPPAAPGGGGAPPTWRASSHKWNIEWKYRVQRANGQYSGEFLLERAMHEATIATNGQASIAKAGTGPFLKSAADPTSTC